MCTAKYSTGHVETRRVNISDSAAARPTLDPGSRAKAGDCSPTSEVLADAAHDEFSTAPAPQPAETADSHPVKEPETPQLANMESSSGSTQLNEGRSYEHYEHYFESPPLPENTPASARSEHATNRAEGVSTEPRTLQEDDTGAVKFTPESPSRVSLPNASDSPEREEDGFIDFGRTAPLNEHVQSPLWPFPETPAHAQNPFEKGKGRSSVLAPSQLFGGTQYSSAMRRPASPTSSRPSPSDHQINSISVSSPLKARGRLSSPAARIPPSTEGLSSKAPQVEEAIVPVCPASPEMPATSTSRHRRQRRTGPEPLDDYEPMKDSQEKMSVSQIASECGLSEDEEHKQRQVRAKWKKTAALERLTSISFVQSTRPDTDRVEVPSTEQKRTSRAPVISRILQSGKDLLESTDSQDRETVADSQDQFNVIRAPPSEAGLSTQSGPEAIARHSSFPSELVAPIGFLPPQLSNGNTGSESLGVGSRDAIPETSPPSRTTGGQDYDHVADATDKRFLRRSTHSTRALRSSSPMPQDAQQVSPNAGSGSGSRAPRQVYAAQTPLMIVSGNTPAERHKPSPTKELFVKSLPTIQSSPPMVDQLVVAKRTRGRSAGANNTPTSGDSIILPPEGSSSLTTLNTTPSLSMSTPSKSVLAGPASRNVGSPDSEHASSPAVAKKSRRMKVCSAENLRQSVRLSRHRSVSTDELARSPQTVEAQTGLFENMAFAISLQGKRPREDENQFRKRMESAEALERKIKEEGGRVLEGFNQLFEDWPIKQANKSPKLASQPDSAVQLTPEAATLGFTALISDGHSRKVKYMQALALNLPCITVQWVSACLAKGQIVDWSRYLLCAGQSSIMGDAILSRNLSRYDASKVQLRDIVQQREQLLEGSKILLVMTKAAEKVRKPYVFLARVLGGTLSRVHNIDEARENMKAAEDAGQPYHWVYVDDKTKPDALYTIQAEPSKKRKRMGVVPIGPAPKKIRTINDELLIQSLILERLVEDTEMDI